MSITWKSSKKEEEIKGYELTGNAVINIQKVNDNITNENDRYEDNQEKQAKRDSYHREFLVKFAICFLFWQLFRDALIEQMDFMVLWVLLAWKGMRYWCNNRKRFALCCVYDALHGLWRNKWGCLGAGLLSPVKLGFTRCVLLPVS